MQAPQPSVRQEDNIFGVCAALGQDFGFNPLWLRLAFGAALLFNPVAVISTYAVAGIIVAVSRLLYPNRRRKVRTIELQAA